MILAICWDSSDKPIIEIYWGGWGHIIMFPLYFYFYFCHFFLFCFICFASFSDCSCVTGQHFPHTVCPQIVCIDLIDGEKFNALVPIQRGSSVWLFWNPDIGIIRHYKDLDFSGSWHLGVNHYMSILKSLSDHLITVCCHCVITKA